MAEEVKVYQHRYKWTTEEKVVLSACVLIILGSVLGATLWGFPVWAAVVLSAVAAFAFGWGVHVGGGRKKKSKLTATYEPSTMKLTVEGNGYDHKNAGSLRNLKSVGTKQVGPNNTLVLVLNNGDHFMVPQRIGKELKDVLVPVLEKRGFLGGANENKNVVEWVQGLDTYNR